MINILSVLLIIIIMQTLDKTLLGLIDLSLKDENDVTKWVKNIPVNGVKFCNYYLKNDFKLVANIELDNDVDRNGEKKRSTVIKFVPILESEFIKDSEYIYLFTIDDIIVKFGGCRNGLKNRIGSYLCGHHVIERGKSGKMSLTNAIVYHTFEDYLNRGKEVKMYAHELEKVSVKTIILGEKVEFFPQVYHVYESKYIDSFLKKYGIYPVLSKNKDPKYVTNIEKITSDSKNKKEVKQNLKKIMESMEKMNIQMKLFKKEIKLS